MNLRPRRFERRLRLRVRGRIAASKELAAERRRVRRVGGLRLKSLLFPLCAAGLVGTGAGKWVREPDHVWPVLALAAVILAVLQASALQAALGSDRRLVVFAHLPIARDHLFRAQFEVFMKGTGWSLAGMQLAYLVTVGITEYPGGKFWTGMGCVVLQWLLSVWAAVTLIRYRPSWPYGLMKLALVAGLFGLFVGKERLASGIISLIERFRAFEWLTPSGWVSLAYENGVNGGDPWMLALLVPVVGLLATGPRLLLDMRTKFVAPEIFAEEESEDETETAANPQASAADRAQVRAALATTAWDKENALEQWILRRVLPGERDVMEFMLGGVPLAMPSYRLAALPIVLALIAMALAPTHRSTLAVVLCGIAFLCVAPVFGGSWGGLGARVLFGMRTSLFCVYPVGYREMERTFLKLNAIRCLLALVPGLTIGLVAGWNLGLPLPASAWLGVKLVLAVLLLQHTVLVYLVSPSTSDTARAPGVILLFVLVFLALSGLTAAFLIVEHPGWSALAGLGAGIVSRFFGWYYRRRFERLRFDVVAVADGATNIE